jgi:L-alanine-DL-glutamate epimerase-like enolase superfamily enzyme
LKIAKLGGPGAVVNAARRLEDAGVGSMVGQMNEGATATALAVHCAMAARPKHCELYGCYGLVDDPTSGLRYQDGNATVSHDPGLGVLFDESRTSELWDIEK